MTDSRWQRTKEILQSALERDPAARDAYVRDACREDAAMQAEVESLLMAHAHAGSFAESPPPPVRGLSPGATFGAYEIVEWLGAGAMGEVYRARDPRLGREVAIKILPRAFTEDPGRLARFEREARILASLNHPNIATVHGFEESGALRGLVMELIDGDTLADLIACVKSDTLRLPIADVLAIARQIADALDAAHEKSIVHRDLKPANIKIRADGTVKVLDFGLAKIPVPDGFGETADGALLGTPAYMSPEQARGKAVDKRSDIWAFGCVLYELITGRQPFAGETLSDTIARVLEREPDWSAVPRDTPVEVRRVLERCLEKDPKLRLRDIGDVSVDLAHPDASRGEMIQRGGFRVHNRERLAWVAAGVMAVASLAALVGWYTRPRAQTAEMHLEIVTPPTSDPLSFAVSPDGRRLVFLASTEGPARLWLRAFNETSAKPLEGTEGASFPFWSPDSRSIGFFSGFRLKRVEASGGPVQTLTEANGFGGTWNEESVIIFPDNVGQLFRISSTGGERVAVTAKDPGIVRSFPWFLPGGRQFLFYATNTDAGAQGIYLGSLDRPDVRFLTSADTRAVYAEPGWLLFVRQGVLVARQFDSARSVLDGEAVRVVDSVAFSAAPPVGAVSYSRAGLLAYRAGEANSRQLKWFDRAGRELGTLAEPDQSGLMVPRLAPGDGVRVAVHRTVQGNDDIWLLEEGRTTRFTNDPGRDRGPEWSPDGRSIVFCSNRNGRNDLYVKASSGGVGSEKLLLETPQDKFVNDWSADGRFILYQSTDPQDELDLWILPLQGDRKPFAFLKTKFNERRGTFSPDGRLIAYLSSESGRYEVYVRPFRLSGDAEGVAPAGGHQALENTQWQVSTAGGIDPRWSSDGREIYYIGPDAKLMAAPVKWDNGTVDIGKPAALFQTQIVGGGTQVNLGWQYDVAHDGRFLINSVADEGTAIRLILNWKPSN